MDLQQMAAWLEEVAHNPDANIDGTAMGIDEELAKDGQTLRWDFDLNVPYIGPLSEEELSHE